MKARALAILCAAALPAAAAARPARAEDVQVIKGGEAAGSIEAYHVGRAFFLDATKAGELYGGRVYWYPVTGRVQMSVRGAQMRFLINSDEARVGARTVKLSTPVLARTNAAFIPVDFFASKAFADAVDMDTRFDSQTRVLTVDRRGTVGSPRWFSYPDRTRVVVEFRAGLGHSLTKRGRSGFDVVFPLGVLDSPGDIEVGDGIVERLSLRQESRVARLGVSLREDAGPWRERLLSNPNRLVLDVYRSPAAMEEARGKPEPRETAADESSGAAPAPAASTGTVAAAPRAQARPRIVVDAGHGGKDSGTSSRRGALEKTINLQAALELARLLREQGGFEVLLTRDADVFIPLADRSRMANEFQADLFISIHANSAYRKAESGFEIYFLSEKASDPDAERTAEMENAALELEGKSAAEEEEAARLLHALAKTEFMNDASALAGLMAKDVGKRVNLSNRGVKQAAFYVLRGTNAPAVLVEMGFMSNSSDAAKLDSPKLRRRLAEGLYAGVIEFAKRQKWKAGKP